MSYRDCGLVFRAYETLAFVFEDLSSAKSRLSMMVESGFARVFSLTDDSNLHHHLYVYISPE